MARDRKISSDFWTWEAVIDCAAMTRLLFLGLWNFADSFGVQPLRPRTIRLQVFPGDPLADEQVRAMIDELVARGLVSIYEAEGQEFLAVVDWHRLHRVGKRARRRWPPDPALPVPPEPVADVVPAAPPAPEASPEVPGVPRAAALPARRAAGRRRGVDRPVDRRWLRPALRRAAGDQPGLPPVTLWRAAGGAGGGRRLCRGQSPAAPGRRPRQSGGMIASDGTRTQMR